MPESPKPPLRLPTAFRPLIVGGIYRHFRNRAHYRVLCSAIHTETGEDLVVYVRDDEAEPYNQVWARPRTIFLENVTLDSGVTVKRFSLQGWETMQDDVKKAANSLLQRLFGKGKP